MKEHLVFATKNTQMNLMTVNQRPIGFEFLKLVYKTSNEGERVALRRLSESPLTVKVIGSQKIGKQDLVWCIKFFLNQNKISQGNK